MFKFKIISDCLNINWSDLIKIKKEGGKMI